MKIPLKITPKDVRVFGDGKDSLGDIIEAAVRRGKKNNRKGAIPSKTK